MSEPRFLIVKFSAIGDCVMTVPAASIIRKTHANAFVCWAVDPRCADVVDFKGLIDVRYDVPREVWKRDHVSWWHQFKHFARLRSFRFDYGIDFQGHSKTAFCLRIARPRVRVATRATDAAARFINPIARTHQKRQHWVERNIEVVRMLGDFVDDSCPIMPDLARERDKVVAEIPKEARLATISVSAGHPKKTYSLHGWEEVAKGLQALSYTVAFLGGPKDPKPQISGCIDWIGKLSLAESMAAVKLSHVHLAADTGTGHVAAAYGVPVVSVFGYTDPAEYRPYTTRGVVLNAGKTMDGVTPAQIIEAAESLLERQVHAILS